LTASPPSGRSWDPDLEDQGAVEDRVPSGQEEEATEPYHVMSSRKLSADDLVNVDDWFEYWRNQFEHIDYQRIDADCL
jgi:hypothetical protein